MPEQAVKPADLRRSSDLLTRLYLGRGECGECGWVGNLYRLADLRVCRGCYDYERGEMGFVTKERR